MKRLCLLLTGLALIVPAGALAQGPPPAQPGASPIAARAVAGALCAAELKQLGLDAFKAKYPSAVVCLDAHADQAAQLLDKCKATADPRACLREALGLSGAPPAPARPEGPRGRGLPLVPLVAGALCRAELESTGVEAFKAKYKTRGACLRANAAKAAGIVKDAQDAMCRAPSARAGACSRRSRRPWASRRAARVPSRLGNRSTGRPVDQVKRRKGEAMRMRIWLPGLALALVLLVTVVGCGGGGGGY